MHGHRSALLALWSVGILIGGCDSFRITATSAPRSTLSAVVTPSPAPSGSIELSFRGTGIVPCNGGIDWACGYDIEIRTDDGESHEWSFPSDPYGDPSRSLPPATAVEGTDPQTIAAGGYEVVASLKHYSDILGQEPAPIYTCHADLAAATDATALIEVAYTTSNCRVTITITPRSAVTDCCGSYPVPGGTPMNTNRLSTVASCARTIEPGAGDSITLTAAFTGTSCGITSSSLPTPVVWPDT